MLFGALSAHAQQQDFRTWTNLELEGEVFDLIDFSIAPELRMMSNSTQLDAVLAEVDLSAPITKFFRLGVEYRFKLSSREELFHNSNRAGVYMELDERIEDLRFGKRRRLLQRAPSTRSVCLLFFHTLHSNSFRSRLIQTLSCVSLSDTRDCSNSGQLGQGGCPPGENGGWGER